MACGDRLGALMSLTVEAGGDVEELFDAELCGVDLVRCLEAHLPLGTHQQHRLQS